MNDINERNRRAAAYSAHVAKLRARETRRKDFIAGRFLAASIALFLWAVSLALVTAAW